MKVQVSAIIYRWLINRSQLDRSALDSKYPQLSNWINGKGQPTMKQLEKLAKTLHAPIGHFFEPAPLNEPSPLVDFRTFSGSNKNRKTPSPSLLDTIYDCQAKQYWYAQYCQMNREEENVLIGIHTIDDDPVEVATMINQKILNNLPKCINWADAFRKRKMAIEQHNILVLTSGTVKGNTRRPLDIDEFRGFAICDNYAPLIFINAKDSIAARNFTLIHELAHLALGESGVSNDIYDQEVEKWCDAVASEVLMPAGTIQDNYTFQNDLDRTINKLAKLCKVSTQAILLRLRKLKLLRLDERAFWGYYQKEKNKALQELINNKSEGGNFYNTKPAAISNRFLTALAISTYEGHTLFRDAMNLANVKTIKTFKKLADKALQQ